MEIQYSEVPIENNYQNMLRSTHAEFCAKKLRNREGDLKLAGSPSLYHQSFGLLWTTKFLTGLDELAAFLRRNILLSQGRIIELLCLPLTLC